MANDQTGLQLALEAWWAADPGPTDTSYRDAMAAAITAYLAALPAPKADDLVERLTKYFTRLQAQFDLPHCDSPDWTNLGSAIREVAARIQALQVEKDGLAEQLRVSELEGNHAYALAVDDPGKNPPTPWKDRAAAAEAERDEALEAEGMAKDCFWAIYPDWVELKGHGISVEAARTLLATRATTAEARVKVLEAAIAAAEKQLSPAGNIAFNMKQQAVYTFDRSNYQRISEHIDVAQDALRSAARAARNPKPSEPKP